MKDIHHSKDEGIKRLIRKGRKSFRISENLNFYSKKDYKAAEKKFIKFCVINQEC